MVSADLLEEVALSGNLPPEVIFRLGVEAQRRRQEADRLRRDVPKAKTLRAVQGGKDWKRLEKAMRSRFPERTEG